MDVFTVEDDMEFEKYLAWLQDIKENDPELWAKVQADAAEEAAHA